MRGVLLLAGSCVIHHIGQGEVGVFGGLGEAAGEIVEAAGQPGVMLAQAIDAQSDQFFREHFGEGRSDRFEVRARGHEIDIGLNGVARGGENAVTLQRLVARDARGFNQAQPFFYAARPAAVTVVVDDALAPGKTKGGVFAACEDGGIFDGDSALVVVAIEGPGLQLAAGEFAFVHQEMERMFMVIALFADGMEAGNEVGFREKRVLRCFGSRHQLFAVHDRSCEIRTEHAAPLQGTHCSTQEIDCKKLTVRAPCHRRRFQSRHPALGDVRGCFRRGWDWCC